MSDRSRFCRRHRFPEVHFFLCGPSCVGKGSSGKQIVEIRYQLGHHITTGGLIRSELNSNLKFKKVYGAAVAAGKHLPDKLVLGLAVNHYNAGLRAGCQIFVWDGIPRTSNQVTGLKETRIPHPDNTLFMMINASEETCLRNGKHPSAKTHRAGRTDNDKIGNRHRDYYNLYPDMRQAIAGANFKVIEIDGNRGIDFVNRRAVEEANRLIDSVLEVRPTRIKGTHQETSPSFEVSFGSPLLA